METRTDREFGAGIPVTSAVLNGLAAYVGGLVGSLVLFVVLGLNLVGSMAFTTVPLDAAVGFGFYGGHFVSVTTSSGESINFALDLASQGSLYVVLVVVLLVASGYDVATTEGVGPRLSERALAGASVVAGYLPLAVAGTFVFEWSTTGGFGGGPITFSLPLPTAALLAGMVFPLVFGGIGGVVASLLE